MNDTAKYVDTNDGEPWSEMDLWDLKNSLAHGRSIEEVAAFPCRSGTVDEVRLKAEELGLQYRSEPQEPSICRGPSQSCAAACTISERLKRWTRRRPKRGGGSVWAQ